MTRTEVFRPSKYRFGRRFRVIAVANCKLQMANTDDMLEGGDTQVGPNTRLGSEVHDIKTVGDVTVVNHDCSTTMNVGSDIKAVKLSAINFFIEFESEGIVGF